MAAPTDTAYILPCNKGIEIIYDGELCVVENVGVQEFMITLKTLEGSTDFKTKVERVANRLILPQKSLTT
jgi:hypothetical protein